MSAPLKLVQLLEQARALAEPLTRVTAAADPALAALLPRLIALADQWAAAAPKDPEVKAGRAALVAVLGDANREALGRTQASNLFTDAAARLRQVVKEVREAEARKCAAEKEAAKEAEAKAKEEAAAKQAQIATERAAASDEALGTPPFILKGWDQARKVIHYQHRDTGQLGSIPPPNGSGTSGLLALAPVEWWERAYPLGGKPGVSWIDAASSLIEAANRCPVFRPESVRGRGVWLDAGRVVWNLGNRLVVDGQPQKLLELDTAHAYTLAPPLPPIEDGPALSDQQGAAILKALQAVGWVEPMGALFVAGWIVSAIVGGALEYRPGLQITAPRGSGKSSTIKRAILPLLGGMVQVKAEITEAAVRQQAKADTIPVLIDESEQGDHQGRTRAGHLRLLRCSFDGLPGGRGTTHGEPLEQLVRYSVALAGINATIPNPADRSRVAIVTRRHLPTEEWQQVEGQLAAAITTETGQALIRRTVIHLHTLMSNARTLARVIELGGDKARDGDCYGTLLAGTHLLTSTSRLTPEAATRWLVRIGWAGAEAQADEDQPDEGRQCLEQILTTRLNWRTGDNPAGEVTLWELAQAAMGDMSGTGPAASSRDVINALGRSGIKVLPEKGWAVAFANNSPGLLKLLERTPWAKGGHRQHLLSLAGAKAMGRERKIRFPSDATPRRAVIVPLEVIQGVGEQAPVPPATG